MENESPVLTPGAVVDNLRIDRVLGLGAYGATYLVTDQVLNKTFALKEYRPQNGAQPSQDGLVEFLAEGRTIAQLDHPHIVKVIRCFEANGTAYLQMPYYRGEALHKLLKRSGVFTIDDALALAKPLLGALEYIHDRGIYHQDIKPANIYITEEGEPILLDFGAAGQHLDDATRAQSRLGSEGYAAPEQSDDRGSIGPWTDIYGFAATLYRCISGQIPAAASRRQSTLAEGQPDPLAPIQSLVPASPIPGVFEAISQGLLLDPSARPRNITAWRPAFRKTGPVRKSVVGSTSSAVPREGREWLSITLVSLFAVVLLGAIVYLFTGDHTGQSQPSDSPATEVTGTGKTTDGLRYATPEETARWQSALEADTAYGYQLFMQDYPDSIHEDQAIIHLERLDHQAWGYAEELDTKEAVEDYMQAFPQGLHEADAKIRLHEFALAEQATQREKSELQQRDEQAWENARTTRTLAAVDGYLSDWPGGLHSDEARNLRGQIESELNEARAFAAAAKLDTIESYQSYVDAFPGGRNVARALEAIDNRTLRPGKTFKDCPGCPTMMVVPAGSYWQGSEENAPLALKMEMPRRMVAIAEPFAVGVFEVTMAQWDQCVSDGGCNTHPPDNGWGRDSRPVIMVSWNDALEYTSWLSGKTGQSYSLPSESQWEYIARAGEEGDWLGGGPARICEYGNVAGEESGFRWQHPDCADPAAIETLPAGSFKPNAFGIYDVVGNVAEWTLDCMNLSYLDAPADGSSWGRGICSSRITRGGSWFTGSREVRLPARFNLKNGDRNDFTGFRVVRKVEPL